MKLRTPLCDLLGIEHPIFCAPMGFITGPELAAAVSEAGGLGIMSFGRNPAHLLRQDIRRVRSETARPFGVNMLLPADVTEHVAVCIEERVPLLSFFWGDPGPFVQPAHEAGLKVMHQVGSVAEAVEAARAGVDVIIAQGVEGGGHIRGEVSTLALVPRVVDAVPSTPVVASGGIADSRGLLAALALGAQGAALGTRFLAAAEARTHPVYQQKILAANETDTVRTTLFGYSWPNAPHRTLRTRFVEEWLSQEARGNEGRPDEPVVGATTVGGETVQVRRFMGFTPHRETSGDIESMALYAGQGVGLVSHVQPAGEIVRQLVVEADSILRR
jgi:NAD(P)H-dependent flavin oxidoreductase YrpB (nitropropane dioxygenase family)